MAGLKIAGAWLVALGPIGWAIAGIGAFIGVLAVLVNKCKPVAEIFNKIQNAIDGAFTAFNKWTHRKDKDAVAKIEADYQARIAKRQEKLDNMGKNKAEKSKNPLDKVISGNALNTKQQGAIELKEEDVKMLNELASRDFMVRYQSLSPQVNFGNVTVNENADIDQLIGAFSSGVEEMANNSMRTGVGK